MRLFFSSLMLGSALFGALSALQAQNYGYGSPPPAGNAYNSPSLLPLPDVTPPPAAYGSQSGLLRPASAVSNVEPSYQGIGNQAEPVPTPTPDNSFSASPSDQPTNSSLPSLQGGSCEAGGGGNGSGGLLGGSPFVNAFKGGWGGSSGCGCDAACGGGCGLGWFGSVGGIALTRNDANRFWTTYDTTNNANQLMNTQFAKAGWGGGGEVTLGGWFGGGGAGGGGLAGGGVGGGMGGMPFGGGAAGGIGGGALGGGCGSCGACGIAATYWGVSPMTGSSSVTSANNTLGTPINEQTQTGTVMMNSSQGQVPSSFFFDGAHQQTLSRVDRINNVEVNFLSSTYLGSGRTQAIWLAGIRYFRFDETLTYGSTAGGYTQGQNGGAYDGYLRNRSVNNLIGPQIGVVLNHYFTPRLGVFVIPKFGVFGNAASTQNTLYTGDGYTTFNLQANKTSFSTLAQLDIGANYMLTNRWSIYGGYRLVAISNLALSDNQFLPYLADNTGFLQPKTNGDLILNGGFAGVLFRF